MVIRIYTKHDRKKSVSRFRKNRHTTHERRFWPIAKIVGKCHSCKKGPFFSILRGDSKCFFRTSFPTGGHYIRRRAPTDRHSDRMEGFRKVELTAVQDKGVWYVDIHVQDGPTHREKVESVGPNGITLNTEEAALELLHQTHLHILRCFINP